MTFASRPPASSRPASPLSRFRSTVLRPFGSFESLAGNAEARHFLPLYAAVLGVSVVLTILYLAFALSATVPLVFDLDAEGTVPVWWSSLQLLATGAVFGLLVLRNRRKPSVSVPLTGLAALLVLMSLDETASLHETIGAYVDRIVVERGNTVFSITGVWFAVLGVPLIVLLTLLFARLSVFFASVPGTLRGFAVGFIVFLGGALGVEAISNFVAGEGMLRVWTTAWEEGFEMIGVGILLCAALRFALLHPSSGDVLRAVLRDAASEPSEPFGPFRSGRHSPHRSR